MVVLMVGYWRPLLISDASSCFQDALVLVLELGHITHILISRIPVKMCSMSQLI